MTGYVDYVDANILRGWAWNATKPKCRITVDVFFRGVFLGRTRTGVLRTDLRDYHGMGDGCHGFLFHFPPDAPNPHLEPSQLKITTCAPERIALINLADETRADKVYQDERSLQTFFGPLLSGVDRLAICATSRDPGQRRLIDQICAQASGSQASAFAEHLALKYSRPGPNADAPKFWSWYLSHYCLEKGPVLAPLSVVDIKFLSGPSKRYIVAAQLIKDEAKQGKSNRYDWAISGSHRLYVEDSLVDYKTIHRLREVPLLSRAKPFALSYFLLRFSSETRLL
ncbi:hypothetical protein, partial [Beijerinckia sp. L45]|uniref:hypothetical protein n=1 Tax=Beijerinckia sp. L45 TaxID=1641855 RepID=UPI00131AEC52